MSEDYAGRVHKVNRIKAGVDKYEELLALRRKTGIGANGLPVDWAKLEAANTLTDREVMQFQTWQSQAFASGILSEEEASWLYQKLGREMPTAKKFNALPMGEKMAIIKAMYEIGNKLHPKFGFM